jgi:hypothetical protein
MGLLCAVLVLWPDLSPTIKINGLYVYWALGINTNGKIR